MSKVKGRCAACGTAFEADVPLSFASAKMAAPFCQACAALQFLGGGGVIFELSNETAGARFALGKVTITGGAIAALADAGEHAASFLARHVRGDWGENGDFDQIKLTQDERNCGWEATDDSGKINKSNVLAKRDRVLSRYATSLGIRLWVITSLDRSGGTTVLLPDEY
jgi:hypothetical protein